MNPNPMPSFKAHSGARVRQMQATVSGPYEALFQTIEKDYGVHCADALRSQVAPWIGAMSDESEQFGSLTLASEISGEPPEITGSPEINAILEKIAKREDMDAALVVAKDCDKREPKGQFQWPADSLAGWRPTLRIAVQGQGQVIVKCKDVLHLIRAKSVVKAAMRKADFALNWRSAVMRAIQGLTHYDGEPAPSV